MRFLGLDITWWLVHQQSYIYAFLQETFDPECLIKIVEPLVNQNHSLTSLMPNHMPPEGLWRLFIRSAFAALIPRSVVDGACLKKRGM